MTGRPLGPARRRAQPLRMRQETRTAPPPASPEHEALRSAAAACWAACSGMEPGLWLDGLEPLQAPLVAAVRTALAEGADVSRQGPWRVLTARDGRQMVVSALVFGEASRGRP